MGGQNHAITEQISKSGLCYLTVSVVLCTAETSVDLSQGLENASRSQVQALLQIPLFQASFTKEQERLNKPQADLMRSKSSLISPEEIKRPQDAILIIIFLYFFSFFFYLLSVLGREQHANTIVCHYKVEIKAVNLFIPTVAQNPLQIQNASRKAIKLLEASEIFKFSKSREAGFLFGFCL